LLDKEKKFVAFGYEAENQYAELVMEKEHDDYYFFHRFKMNLHNNKVFHQPLNDFCYLPSCVFKQILFRNIKKCDILFKRIIILNIKCIVDQMNENNLEGDTIILIWSFVDQL
jgi:hypothetical protein